MLHIAISFEDNDCLASDVYGAALDEVSASGIFKDGNQKWQVWRVKIAPKHSA